MGIGHLSEFQVAGKTLFSLGLVRGAEGNLSTLDEGRLRITRAGARLHELAEADVVDGSIEAPGPGSSSDLALHVALYGDTGARAVVHAHPPGTVPVGWREGDPHGVYVAAPSLDHAVAAAAAHARDGADGAVRPIRFDGETLAILDQTRLPRETVVVACVTPEDVGVAIRRMAVRGAPVLGIAAGYAMALATALARDGSRVDALASLEAAGRMLASTRPTAVNIRWAVDRVLSRARATPGDGARMAEAVADEARAIEREDASACEAMARFGAELVPAGARILTHCNTGTLCTGGVGTALGVIAAAHRDGKGIHVWVDETRPALQGARLTAWELGRLGVPSTLIADAAAGSIMAAGRVDLVIVGADRIAANGDVANKIGTYPLAILARHHGLAFYVAAPASTVDLATASGADIPIEERDPTEVTAPFGFPIAPPGVEAANPAFDVTPAELVTAFITDRGVVRPPYSPGLLEAVAGRGTA